MASPKTQEKPVVSKGVILAAINNITECVGSVTKLGVNEDQGYNYATAADVMGKLQPLLVREGLVIIPSEVSHELMADAVLAVTYEFTIGHKSGEIWPDRPRFTGISRLVSKSGAVDDKAGNKTLTAASKYFALNLFKIPTRDADDADATGEGVKVSKPQAAKAPDTPKPVQAPHDPATGELTRPSKLAAPGAPDGPKSWIDWGSQFIAAIDAAVSPEDVVQWGIANSATIQEMAKAAPRAKARLMERVDQARKRTADDFLKRLDAALAVAATSAALTQTWQRSPSLGSLNKDDHDRAVSLYEGHVKRVGTSNALAA